MQARDGLPILGPELVELVRRLDNAVTGWASDWNVPEYFFSELISVADLARIDYLVNFPQLALCATGLKADALEHAPAGAAGEAAPAVATERLDDARYVLQSAACYPLYFALEGQSLAEPLHVTLVGRVFRREDYFKGFERLREFRQREIVCVGPSAAVQENLERCRTAFMAFALRLGLRLTVAVATDAFFGKDAARAKMQRLFPTKHELVHDGRVAVASLNSHRNFFGERCRITLPGGEHAFSGCFGVGLERLAGVLVEEHGTISQALARVCDVQA
jgi:seryl-tRNA synthetase